MVMIMSTVAVVVVVVVDLNHLKEGDNVELVLLFSRKLVFGVGRCCW